MRTILRNNWLELLSLAVVIAALWLPRGLALDKFVTPDEPKWLTRSANFYLALVQRDFASTYQKEHPGVSVMWAGTAGFLTRFPAYVKIGSEQQDRPQKLKRFLDNHEIDVMPLLAEGRRYVVLAIVAALALSYLAAVRLLGLIPALAGFLLVAFDPFLIALSRLLHLDGLVSALMLLSLLTWLNYLYRGRRLLDLFVSGASAGLSWLTKSPALFLLPFLGLVCLVEIGRGLSGTRRLTWADLWHLGWPVLVWTGIAAGLFVLLWPAMWVNPLNALQQIFTAAASYASEGHDSITYFNGAIYQGGISDWRFYPVNYYWRTTPPTLLGLALLILALLLGRRFPLSQEKRLTTLCLGVFVLLFTIFMTTGAKKFDRYLLPIFAPLDLLAGLGWVAVLGTVLPHSGRTMASRWARPMAVVFLVGVIAFQAWSALGKYPYYFTYYNPMAGGSARAGQVMMIGWGEGLDQAARYLNTKPNAEKLQVASWYPDGPFSYLFVGDTSLRDLPSLPEDLPKVDYLVLYAHQWQRQLPSQEFLAYFESLTPEKIITIHGLEYARIYQLRKE